MFYQIFVENIQLHYLYSSTSGSDIQAAYNNGGKYRLADEIYEFYKQQQQQSPPPQCCRRYTLNYLKFIHIQNETRKKRENFHHTERLSLDIYTIGIYIFNFNSFFSIHLCEK